MATKPKDPSDQGPDQAPDQATVDPQLSGQCGDYEHAQQAVQRPAVGVQDETLIIVPATPGRESKASALVLQGQG